MNTCTDLVELSIQGCSMVGDAALIALCTKCIHCESLNLSGCCKISNNALLVFFFLLCNLFLQGLGNLPLKTLEASELSQLTNKSFENLTQLCHLDISNCPNITDEALILVRFTNYWFLSNNIRFNVALA